MNMRVVNKRKGQVTSWIMKLTHENSGRLLLGKIKKPKDVIETYNSLAL